mgnify:FL=1
MSLADRINIHYKIGNFTKVSFNSEEQWFVDQAFKTNTFKDVLELAQKLYEHIKEEQEQLTKFDDLEFSFGEEGSSGQGMPFQPSDSDDGIEMEGDSDSEDGDGGEGQSNSQRPSMEDLNDDLQSASDISGGVHGGVEGAVTDKALQSNLENLNKESTNTYYEPEYVELPQLNLETVIASNKSVHEYLTEYWIGSQKHFDAESELSLIHI